MTVLGLTALEVDVRGGDLGSVAPAIVSHADRTELSFWPLPFDNVTLCPPAGDDSAPRPNGRPHATSPRPGMSTASPEQRIVGHRSPRHKDERH